MSSNIGGGSTPRPRENQNPSRGRQQCASCRHRRKQCIEDCIMAPYFPLERAQELKAVLKAFRFEMVEKKLRDLRSNQERHEAVNSLIWTAQMWEKYPVRGPQTAYMRLEQEHFSTKQELQRIIAATSRPQQETNDVPYSDVLVPTPLSTWLFPQQETPTLSGPGPGPGPGPIQVIQPQAQEEIGPNGSEDGAAVPCSCTFSLTDGHGEQERQGQGHTIPKLRIFFT